MTVGRLDPARDGEVIADHHGGQDWLVSWHPARAAPDGRPHGATAICRTTEGRVVLVRIAAGGWSLPGGRPEAGETWEETMRREVLEEACARVSSARLLGYTRGACIQGSERGLVLVRSLWLADVDLLPWQAEWEMTERATFPASEALDLARADLPPGQGRMITRLFVEAGPWSDGPA